MPGKAAEGAHMPSGLRGLSPCLELIPYLRNGPPVRGVPAGLQFRSRHAAHKGYVKRKRPDTNS
eukprot:4171308-Alexandrium_andersonii.AAC.1